LSLQSTGGSGEFPSSEKLRSQLEDLIIVLSGRIVGKEINRPIKIHERAEDNFTNGLLVY
jgi:hypothetical protein